MPIEISDVLEVFGPGARVLREERKLRGYQEKLVDEVREALRSHRRVLMQSCVGSGKTDVAGHIVHAARARGSRVLFVCHRKELIDNAVERFVLWNVAREDIGVIRADDVRTNPSAPVQVASIQSLSRRAPLSPAPDLIIIDECHRARSDSYMGLISAYPEAVFIGLSASPLRTDGRGLQEFFGALMVGPQPSELIALGALSKPRVYAAPITVKVSANVLNSVDELGEVMSAPRLVGNVVAEYKRVASHLSAFCFAASVQHSRTLNEKFNREGIVSRHVDGTTPDDEREAAFQDLSSGAIRVLCNYGVAVEGVDVPRAKCCIMARPTSSLVVWIQSTGRVLRPYEGMQPIILDHGGNTERHGSCCADREWTLEGSGRAPVENLYRICKLCFAYVETTKPCPLCLRESESKTPAEIQADESVVLEEVLETPEALAHRKQVFFERMLRKAAANGYKPTMPPAAFMAEFKCGWPNDLAKKAKERYESDEEWQRKTQARS